MADTTVYLVESPLLGSRLIHCPEAGVIHITSNTTGARHLTGLVDKDYPTAKESVAVTGPGEICRSGNASVNLTEEGQLVFVSDADPVIRETGVERGSTVINGAKYPSIQVYWASARDDAVYGLGQYQDGVLNARGTVREGHQKNLENCVPLWLSSQGFGILWDHPAPVTLEAEKDGPGVALKSLTADTVDYYFLAGPTLDAVIDRYRALTGDAPMPPRWAFGYHQSKERYRSPDEIRAVAKWFRETGFPLDLIIQDWQYWGDHGWNACRFDPDYYPDARQMIKDLHARDIRYIVSVWPSFNEGPKGSAVYKELDAAGLLAPHKGWLEMQYYDAFSDKAREIVWRHAKNLWDHDIDGWWLDASEPELGGGGPAGQHQTVEHLDRFGPCAEGAFVANANPYPLYANKAFVDGQLSTGSDKRVFILTRSAYSGLQRYGAFVWSGDIRCSWDTLRKQVPCGLGFVLSGISYWNSDIGGFACAYPDGCDNPDFRELNARWFQFGAFCAQFRMHGTSTPREPYRFGEPGEETYDTLIKFARLRYRLLPYIYSQAWRVTRERYTLMRPLVMDYSDDPKTRDLGDQYSFGPSLMVAPVLDPAPTDRGDIIPSAALIDTDGEPGALTATYFQGRHFNEERVIRRDARIEFNWSKTPRVGMGADPALDPVEGMEMNNFSVRWEGSLVPERTTDYRFTVRSDDGFRLWIGDELVGQDWSTRGLVSMTYTVPLRKGEATPIKMEYYHETGTAIAELYWSDRPPAKVKALATREVYLPAGRAWYDFWTGDKLDGGQTLSREVPLTDMPVFVPAGSILPLGPEMQHSGEKPADPLDIRVYAGQDAEFTLYEDAGDGFAYRDGECAIIPFTWDEAAQTLHIGTRRGEFDGMLKERRIMVTLYRDGEIRELTPVIYSGDALTIAAN